MDLTVPLCIILLNCSQQASYYCIEIIIIIMIVKNINKIHCNKYKTLTNENAIFYYQLTSKTKIKIFQFII